MIEKSLKEAKCNLKTVLLRFDKDAEIDYKDFLEFFNALDLLNPKRIIMTSDKGFVTAEKHDGKYIIVED